MRKVLIAAVFAAVALIVDLRTASAGGGAPWCALIALDEDGGYEDCRYATFEACRPNVLAGLRGFCVPNSAYVEPKRQPRKSRVKRR